MKHLVEISLPGYFVQPVSSGPVTNDVANFTLHEKAHRFEDIFVLFPN
jgi:hypothetical protein